jgi:integrase/recombinase XerD
VNQIERFLQEKAYLQNVSSATIDWYRHALRKLPCEMPSQEQMDTLVMTLRESGLKETGVNACSRALNCYLKWSNNPAHIRKLREPQFIPPTFTDAQVQSIIRFHPRTFHESRTQLCVLILLDTGARISEILSLRRCDCDMDNLLLTLFGKGRKQRIVPMSIELRRLMYAYTREKQPDDFVLSTSDGKSCNRNVVLREVKSLCQSIGFEPPSRTLHATRSTFATAYLRRGGSALHLQRVLGHSTLTMTSKYVALLTDDLSASHERVSLLNGTQPNPTAVRTPVYGYKPKRD